MTYSGLFTNFSSLSLILKIWLIIIDSQKFGCSKNLVAFQNREIEDLQVSKDIISSYRGHLNMVDCTIFYTVRHGKHYLKKKAEVLERLLD